MNILVIGGAGYIESHTVIELLQAGHDVVIDNLVNSSQESLRRVQEITGKSVVFYEEDVRNEAKLAEIFATQYIDAVVHFAGLKAVGESVEKPLLYYHNNLESTLALLSAMQQAGIKKLVFSSSATVYEDPEKLPIVETMSRSTTNPYGATKLMIEQMLEDLTKANDGWNITSLRYFNPVGAHASGLIGEDPNGIPNNLLPYVSQVAIGKREQVNVFGNDYDTPDGTGVRDYIHVVDLAKAHLAALDYLDHPDIYKAYNIGAGSGVSVLELIGAISKAAGKDISYVIAERWPGDVAACYADVSLPRRELEWQAQLSIEKACNKNSWNWQKHNPDGFGAK